MKRNLLAGLFIFFGFSLIMGGLVFNFWRWRNNTAVNHLSENLTPSAAQTTLASPTPSPLVLTFGGDMMFDRHIRKAITESGPDHILGQLTTFLNQSDLVIANLEGPVTNNPSKSLGSVVGSSANFIFTFDPSITEILKTNNIQLVNLGNNHILNFGQDGLTQTYYHLDQAEIAYFGHTSTTDLSKRSFQTSIKGVKLGFVNYNEFVSGGKEAALADIQTLRPVTDILIVYTHWGAEYQTTANTTIQNLAHQFIEAGADVIIGSHPHVTQQREEYQGKTIYYSLGNFVFDQYFEPNVQKGLLVNLTIDPLTRQMSFQERSIQMVKGGQTVLNSY